MSKDKYVQQTLALPAQMPLFNYNINFDGLRKLLEDVNVKTNNNQQNIQKLQQIVSTKLPSTTLQQTQKKLGACFLFGQRSQNYVDEQELKIFKAHRTNLHDLPEIDQFCWKMNRMAEMVELLMGRTDDHEQRLGADSKRYEKMVDDSFRRLEEKLNSHIDSFTKTINGYFSQTNQKVAEQQSSLNTHKLTLESKLKDLNSDMNKKVSDNVLKAVVQGVESKIKKQLESVLKNDQMQRLATVNDLKNVMAQAQKDQQLRNKLMSNKMQQFTEKVNKALLITSFDIQKHKIFERMSEIKSRTDDLWKKNNEFMEFRKTYLTNNEKIKEEIVGINDQLKKLNQNQSGFKKMEGMTNILSSLNPHRICELGEEVELHRSQIGRLEKQVMQLQKQLQNYEQQKPKPQVNNGQNSDLIQKIIKQFMSNMNFEDRVKRSEKEIAELKKRNDTFSQLQKKIYHLSREIDVPAIMKELNRKCDEQNTRKDTKILDGKIEQLFEFYKQLRKELEQKKRVNKNDSFQNASLTTKKLVSANCLSCTPSIPSTRRNYSGRRLEVSVDYGMQSQKNTIYSRMGH